MYLMFDFWGFLLAVLTRW